MKNFLQNFSGRDVFIFCSGMFCATMWWFFLAMAFR